MLKKEFLMDPETKKEYCLVKFTCTPPNNLFENPVISVELRGNSPKNGITWEKGIKMQKADSTFPSWEVTLKIPVGLVIEFRYLAKDLHNSCTWLSDTMPDDEVLNEFGSSNSVVSTIDDEEQILKGNYW